MDEKVFENFLLGTSDDQQQQKCEDLLANPETVVDCQTTVADDPLVSALKVDDDLVVDFESVRSLASRIEQLVPRPAICTEELQQILAPSTQPEYLGAIDKYDVLELLAMGGSGLVFRAVDSSLNRQVCIKLLKPSSQYNLESKLRFERESRDAAQLANDRIVAVLDAGTQNGLPWFAMPMLEGQSLRAHISKLERIEPREALRYVHQIAEGLQYAHARSLLHRDIKPDNLWVTENNDIKILDFGLARETDQTNPITHEGTIVGTPSYMSPEQVQGKQFTEQSDLFSVGVVLVEMLTGRSPFQKSNLFSTLMTIAGEQIDVSQFDPENKIPIGIRELAQDLLQIEPEKRIGSASELLERLTKVQAEPEKTHAIPRSYVNAGNGWIKAIVAGIFTFAICLAGLAIWTNNDKGTLVVEAADPQVEIKIADETVTVFDPLTKRSHKIRIGDTSLPSGVYLLEAESASGDLVFSSETIAIRRGKRVIVTVSLKPNPNVDSEKIAVDKEPETWVDPTYDPMVYIPENRKRVSEAIEQIPTIPIFDSLKKRVFSNDANAQSPAPLKGIDAWTVETTSTGESKNRSAKNSDNTLQAVVDKSTLRIESKGQLKYILPLRGVSHTAQFDSTYPNLLAVSSFTTEPGTPLEDMPINRLEISIWRTNLKSAELLHRTPASSFRMAWDKGYRIAFFKDDKLTLLRLADGLMHQPGHAADDFFLSDFLGRTSPFSPNGRFIITNVQSGSDQLNLWDLKSGKFLFSIPGGFLYHWKQDSSRIAAISQQNPSAYEIWKTTELARVSTVDLPVTFGSANGTQFGVAGNMGYIVGHSLNSDFSKIAWIRNEDKAQLFIRDLANNRQFTLPIDELELPKMENPAGNYFGRQVTIRWTSDNELSITSKLGQMDCKLDNSKLVGYFRKANAERDMAQNVRHGDPLELRLRGPASSSGALSIEWTTEQIDSPTNGDSNVQNSRFGGSGSRFASQTTTLFNKSELDLRHLTLSPQVSVSPRFVQRIYGNDRRFFLEKVQANRNGRSNYTARWLNALEIGISDVNDLKNKKNLGTYANLASSNFQVRIGAQNIQTSLFRSAWSNDSRFLLTAGCEIVGSRRTEWKLKLFDREKNEIIDAVELDLPETQLEIQPWSEDKFLVCRQNASETSKGIEGWIVDPQEMKIQSVELFKEFESITLIQNAGPWIIFRGRKSDEIHDPAIAEPFEYKYYRARLPKSRNSFVDPNPIVAYEFDQVNFSSDGQLASIVTGDRKVLVQNNKRNARTQGAESLTIKSWDENKILFRTQLKLNRRLDFQWHPHANVATWTNGRDFVEIFDAREIQYSKTFRQGVTSISANQTGWIYALKNKLIAANMKGNILGQIVFDPLLVDDRPANPRLILADGAIESSNNDTGLFFAFSKNDQVFGASLNAFRNDAKNPKLPVADENPFAPHKRGLD